MAAIRRLFVSFIVKTYEPNENKNKKKANERERSVNHTTVLRHNSDSMYFWNRLFTEWKPKTNDLLSSASIRTMLLATLANELGCQLRCIHLHREPVCCGSRATDTSPWIATYSSNSARQTGHLSTKTKQALQTLRWRQGKSRISLGSVMQTTHSSTTYLPPCAMARDEDTDELLLLLPLLLLVSAALLLGL